MRHRVARPALLAAAVCLTALTTACSLLDPSSPATTPGGASGANLVYYVSLGDSLSQGVQPSGDGQKPTDQGYADDVYAHYRAKLGSSFTLVKLGCSGETTSTMLTGHGSPCSYQQGSQLAAALAFIQAHRSRIALITIDIGANDVVPCFESASSFSESCATASLAEATSDLPKILGAIRQAVGSQTVIAGMTLYDPWLAYYLTGGAGKTVAEQSLSLVEQLNQLLTTAYRSYGVRKVDVQGTFDTANYSTTASIPEGGTAPLDVARICQWTWMCTAQNIHANATGYQQIGNAFVRIVGVLRKPTG